MTNSSSNIGSFDFLFIQQFLHQHAGFVLEDGKEYLLETRLRPVMSSHGVSTVSELVSRMRSQPNEPLHRAVIEAMMNGETTFFRDIACFDALKKRILPDLIARREREKRLQIWCACCSTGQEPYSVAMLLLESFPQLADWNIRIIATDISRMHLDRARSGRYAQFEVNRGLPASMLVKHFDQDGNDWVLSSSIRKRVEFQEVNMTRVWPILPLMDVILLRNVMIYWDLELKKTVLARIREVMRPDAYLILGGAETTYYVDEAFERIGADTPCCFRIKR